MGFINSPTVPDSLILPRHQSTVTGRYTQAQPLAGRGETADGLRLTAHGLG